MSDDVTRMIREAAADPRAWPDFDEMTRRARRQRRTMRVVGASVAVAVLGGGLAVLVSRTASSPSPVVGEEASQDRPSPDRTYASPDRLPPAVVQAQADSINLPAGPSYALFWDAVRRSEDEQDFALVWEQASAYELILVPESAMTREELLATGELFDASLEITRVHNALPGQRRTHYTEIGVEDHGSLEEAVDSYTEFIQGSIAEDLEVGAGNEEEAAAVLADLRAGAWVVYGIRADYVAPPAEFDAVRSRLNEAGFVLLLVPRGAHPISLMPPIDPSADAALARWLADQDVETPTGAEPPDPDDEGTAP